MTGEVIALEGSVGREAEDAAGRLAALFDAHHRRLFSLACRMCRTREDARDCVQETFLRAARRPDLIPYDGGNQEAWLVRVLINICRDGWRREAVRQAAPIEPPEASGSHESALIARSVVQRALGALPPRRRAILVLYELEGASVAEIARLCGVAAVTVRWHLSVGRRQMAAMLKARGTERPGEAGASEARLSEPPEGTAAQAAAASAKKGLR